LHPLLSELERRDLYFIMARKVIGALKATPGIDKVLVVTTGSEVANFATQLGAEVILQSEDKGTAAAFAHAIACLPAKDSAEYPQRLLMIPGDLPLISTADMSQLVSQASTQQGVCIVPDRKRVGTNALLCSPPDAIPPYFGSHSFDKHLAAAQERGVTLQVFESAALSLDIDVADDLALLGAHYTGLPDLVDAVLRGLLARLRTAAITTTQQDHPMSAIPNNRSDLRASPEAALQLVDCSDWRELAPRAAALRDLGWGPRITYSRKVFVPLTQLCRDVCHYCTFAKTPKKLDKPYLTPDDVLKIARQGAAAGCKEVLFTLGDKPELRYKHARDALAELGFDSTLAYLEHVAGLVLKETGLLPHLNPGLLDADDYARLKKVAPSMGIMLESASDRLCGPGMAHYGSPDKAPSRRIETLRLAGEAKVPMTTGILIGIGETRQERIEALLAIRDLNDEHGQIQEVIVQNFRAKPGTKMHDAPEPSMDELCWTVAAARLIFGPAMSLQVPPNLYSGDLTDLIRAGINDWGGVSPITPDHVNPEAPWPHLDRLAAETQRAGFDLVERLTVYPKYIEQRSEWLSPELQGPVLRLTDSGCLARVGQWSPGSTEPANHDDRRDVEPSVTTLVSASDLVRKSNIVTLVDRMRNGHVATEIEIAELFTARGSDFTYLTASADELRHATVGDTVTYAVVRNINYTNICMYKCGFCAFSKGKTHEALRGQPYLVDKSEIQRRVREAWDRGATEVCMQGGIHPSFTGQTYLDILRAAKEAVPEMHVHAFSPLEVSHGAQTLGISLAEYLQTLKAAGLGSLPGTAAEVLDDGIRSQLAPDKMPTTEWLHIVGSAHRAGLPTTSTIMFGHLEGYIHWARHLLRLRELQAETGGITEFVPLPFVHMEAPMYLHGKARKGPTLREAILMHSVARLVLHPLIKNVQVSWTKLGPHWAQRCLQAGANDMGGTLMNESISRAAGAAHGQEFSPIQMEALIVAAGRMPMQRSTLYKSVSEERHQCAKHAAPLTEPVLAKVTSKVVSFT
jgi:FO synthase